MWKKRENRRFSGRMPVPNRESPDAMLPVNRRIKSSKLKMVMVTYVKAVKHQYSPATVGHCLEPASHRRFTDHGWRNAGVAPVTPSFLQSTDGSTTLCGLPPAFCGGLP
ncbi:hypothetical protein HAX54_002775, partial [Datura stramonium]|nr:hypothetical protein [Datura stramonium]